MKKILPGCLGSVFLLGVLGLPALDFALIVRIVYLVSMPGLSPFLAIVLGAVAGGVVCWAFIAKQGSTLLELFVPSAILLVLLLIFYPVATQLSEKSRANLQKRALKAKQQRDFRAQVTPQP